MLCLSQVKHFFFPFAKIFILFHVNFSVLHIAKTWNKWYISLLFYCFTFSQFIHFSQFLSFYHIFITTFNTDALFLPTQGGFNSPLCLTCVSTYWHFILESNLFCKSGIPHFQSSYICEKRNNLALSGRHLLSRKIPMDYRPFVAARAMMHLHHFNFIFRYQRRR